jgi:hypothetical protein
MSWYSDGLRSGWQEFDSQQRNIQTGSGAQESSYSVRARGYFPGVKRRGVKLTTHIHLVLR